jgi:signal transduction histidine kinase
LRARATLAFGAVGLFASVLLALSTYLVARSYLLDERVDSAQQQAFTKARLTRSALRSADLDVAAMVASVQGGAESDIVLWYEGGWYASSVTIGRDDVPVGVRRLVSDRAAAKELVRGRDGDLRLVVGTPLAAVEGQYFEVFPLRDLDRTLVVLRNVLIAAAAATSVAAAAVGRYAAGRVVQPLAPVSAAARRIAGGDLGARLPTGDDRDLRELTASFNAMGEALQERIDREARFVSDVSHELRSPLAALRAAIEVAERRRADLPESLEASFEVLSSRIRSLERLVLDLLEISRYDAGAVAAELTEVDVERFVREVIATSEAQGVELHLDGGGPTTIRADRRRLAQAMRAIFANADTYAGGVTDVSVERKDGRVHIAIDDHGPGITPQDRTTVLGRFARGEEGRRAGPSSGTGLGLALTVAQVELHGGVVRIDAAPGGGARFVIDLPASPPAAAS